MSEEHVADEELVTVLPQTIQQPRRKPRLKSENSQSLMSVGDVSVKSSERRRQREAEESVENKRITMIVGTVTGFIFLAAFALIAVTLKMTPKIDEMRRCAVDKKEIDALVGRSHINHDLCNSYKWFSIIKDAWMVIYGKNVYKMQKDGSPWTRVVLLVPGRFQNSRELLCEERYIFPRRRRCRKNEKLYRHYYLFRVQNKAQRVHSAGREYKCVGSWKPKEAYTYTCRKLT